MRLAEIVNEFDSRQLTLSVVNRSSPDPVQRMLDGLFEGQTVTVTERTTEMSVSDLIVLHTDDAVEDISTADVAPDCLADRDDIVAVSSFDALRDGILTVNSDLYTSGARSLGEIDTPDVLTELDGVRFTAAGYPDTRKQKLLLIEMSRYIEARAFDHGEGTLYSGFQQLRRIEDERGTQAAYDQLTRTDVDLHLYGASGRSPYELDATIHAEPCRELRRTWFVIYDHPADRADVGLVAIETDRNQWDGLWTYSTSLIEEVTTHLQNRYH